MTLEASQWVFDDSVDTLYNTKRHVAESAAEVAQLIAQQLLSGHKIVSAGLSTAHSLAAMAGVKFSARLEMPRPGLPAMVLGADNATFQVLCYDQEASAAYVRLIESSTSAGDVLLWFTPAGLEYGTDKVIEAATDQGLNTVWICSGTAELSALSTPPTYTLQMSAESACRTEEAQLVTLNAICTMVETSIFGTVSG